MNNMNHSRRIQSGVWIFGSLVFCLVLFQPGTALAQVTGSGQVNKVPKWISSTGALGDSAITEVNGNVGINILSPQDKIHIDGSSGGGFTINTPASSVKGRFATLPNVPNWMGVFINSAFSGSAWNLDDTSRDGWFFKVDSRSVGGTLDQSNSVSIYRIPAGANPPGGHTDEYPVFSASVDRVSVGKMPVSGLYDGTFNVYVGTGAAIGLMVKGASGQAANLQEWRNAAGTAVATVSAAGTITATNIVAQYQDVAEWVPASRAIPAGTVVILDTERSNHVLPSSREYDTRVAGVVSARPGVILGEGGAGKVMVATTGRVRVKVDATNAPIRVGDLLVTSYKEGIAMRSQPLDLGGTPIHRPGTLIGKALEPLAKGVGEILVLLSLQ